MPVLIPGIDLLNHSPSAKVTWCCGERTRSNFEIIAEEPSSEGKPIFNNYGEQKSNDERTRTALRRRGP